MPDWRRSFYDKQIALGRSAPEIAKLHKELGYGSISKQAVHLYIQNTHQTEFWKARRDAAREQENQMRLARELAQAQSSPQVTMLPTNQDVPQDLSNLIPRSKHTVRAFSDPQLEELIEQQLCAGAFETLAENIYTHKFSHGRQKKESVLQTIRIYAVAQDLGAQLSFDRIAQLAKLPTATSAHRIITKSGGKSLIAAQDTRDRHQYSEEVKKALMHAAPSLADLMAFTKIPYSTLQKWATKYERPAREQPPRFVCRGKYVTHWLCSLVYAHDDKHMSDEVICNKLNIDQKTLQFARSNRSTYEPEIMDVLRIMHPKTDIQTGYLHKYEKTRRISRAG